MSGSPEEILNPTLFSKTLIYISIDTISFFYLSIMSTFIIAKNILHQKISKENILFFFITFSFCVIHFLVGKLVLN